MSLPELEKIATSIVVLAGVEREINLNLAEIGKIIREPAGAAAPPLEGQPVPLLQITSVRDQVVITVQGGRFTFDDKSDSKPGEARLPDIVHRFVGLLQAQNVDRFRAWGLNFDVAFDSRGDEVPSKVIADRFVDQGKLQQRGQMTVRGAGLRLYFDHADALCEMNLEPRFGKWDAPKFFAHINYHYELPDGQMPALDDLQLKYKGLYSVFIDLLGRLLS